jgi:hypothetical protein
MLNMMIFGIHDKVPTLQEIFLHNAVSWMGTKARLLRFEDLLQAPAAARQPMPRLSSATCWASAASNCPATGASAWDRLGPEQSGTARENLRGVGADIPNELPAMQKRLVEHAAPGLRALLGYE